tara:strand:+ start:3197 stop:4048 length:852 start_codon:yes stop_codon:yes gene_type:complete
LKNLALEKPVDEHLKPVKDFDGTSTSLEVSTDKIRVKDLEVTGTTIGIDTGTSITVDSSLTDGSTNPVENNAVFDGLATKLNLSGGTMEGAIDADGNNITNVGGFSAETMANSASSIDTIDNGTSLGTSASTLPTQNAVKGYVDAVPTNVYSKTLIKVMPREFIVNDDYNGRAANIIEDDTSNELAFRMGNSNTEAYAFVKIPDGYKATHVQVLASASTSNAVVCKTFNYTTGATTDLETFDFNTNENITDVTASTTNDLVIKILPASTLTKIYGAKVTIASV